MTFLRHMVHFRCSKCGAMEYRGRAAVEAKPDKPSGCCNAKLEHVDEHISKPPTEMEEGDMKRKVKKLAAPKRRIAGRTTKLPVDKTWEVAFQRATKEKWTDERISRFMKSEFPDRKTALYEPGGVRRVRKVYNSGDMHGQTAKPKVQNVPFDKNGKPIVGRQAPNGQPMNRRVVVRRKKK